MQDELHIFIIWNNALHIKDEIIEDLKNHFEILQIFNINWQKDTFSLRLAKFYHKNLYHAYKKEKECNNGNFYLILVKDHNPQYNDRGNTKTIELKAKYRKWSKGSFLIHASDTPNEAKENLQNIFDDITNIEETFQKTWDNATIKDYTPKPITATLSERIYLKLVRFLRYIF